LTLDLLTLADAAKRFPGGGLTAKGLRRQLRRHGLALVLICNKHFVETPTLEALIRKCRENPNLPASPSAPSPTAPRPGSSETGQPIDGQALAESAAKKLRKPSPIIVSRIPGRHGPARPHEITVGEVLAHYAEGRGPHVADPERLGYTIRALAPFWGGLRMDAVKGETCRRYARQRARNGIGPGTVRRELGTLAAAINWCFEEAIILNAPKVVKPKRPPPKDRYLTRDEAARLLRAARGLGWERRYVARFIVLALYTGSRKQAILGLRTTPSLTTGWVDLDRGVIHRKGAGEGATKKRRGSVRMGRKLASHMARFCARSNGHVIEYRGGPVAGIKRAWGEICEAAGLKDVTPHTLKHTAITWAIANGMSREDAASYYSTSIQTIEATYWHHSPHYQKTAAEITDKKAR
jgi:integrase